MYGIGFSIAHFIGVFDRYSARYRDATLRARFLEDAEPVVIVIDYNVIARSLFGSSFVTWSILELSVLTVMTAKGYWGTF